MKVRKQFFTPDEQRAVTLFQERVRTWCGERPVSFRLFGSKARGDNTPDSDIDILVLVDDAPGSVRGAIYGIAGDVLVETDIDLSPLVMSTTHYQDMLRRERRLAEDIATEGIAL